MGALPAIIPLVFEPDRTGRSKSGYAIAARMKELGLSQQAVARAVGRRQPWVGQYLLADTEKTIRHVWLQNPGHVSALLRLLQWTPSQFEDATGVDLSYMGSPQQIQPREAAIPADVVRIPFRGVAAAGAAPDPDATIEIPSKFARSGSALYVVQGESMVPTFEDGDTLLVDETLRVTRNNGVYAIRLVGNGVQIRRCFVIGGQVMFVPDNSGGSYPSYNLEDDDIEIMGQVYSRLSAQPI
jgi:SOS-response transcriptional repressor LexA